MLELNGYRIDFLAKRHRPINHVANKKASEKSEADLIGFLSSPHWQNIEPIYSRFEEFKQFKECNLQVIPVN
jgi:hypothetical protein